MSQLCLNFDSNKTKANKSSWFCQTGTMQNYKTTHNYSSLPDLVSAPQGGRESTAKPELSATDNFFDMTDEEISELAKESTSAAVKDLHDRGISTYGMRDGIMYETKPNGEKVAVSEAASHT
jgi:hypothetical protein